MSFEILTLGEVKSGLMSDLLRGVICQVYCLLICAKKFLGSLRKRMEYNLVSLRSTINTKREALVPNSIRQYKFCSSNEE